MEFSTHMQKAEIVRQISNSPPTGYRAENPSGSRVPNPTQIVAVLGSHLYNQRTRFGRRMDRNARKNFAVNFQYWSAPCNTFFHAGQRQTDFPNGIEVRCWFGHRSL